MAETAGLVIGGIALASLFETCVKYLEYFDVARSFAYDHELARTKVGLLETRLKQWGSTMRVQHPGQELGALRQCWPDESGIVGRSLSGVADTLGSVSKLSEKYGLGKIRRPSDLVCVFIKWRPKSDRKSASACPSSRRSLISFRKSAAWAIRDKKKFDALIVDLDFLITNLEKVCCRVSKPDDASSEGSQFALADSVPVPSQATSSSEINDMGSQEQRTLRQQYRPAVSQTGETGRPSWPRPGVAPPQSSNGTAYEVQGYTYSGVHIAAAPTSGTSQPLRTAAPPLGNSTAHDIHDNTYKNGAGLVAGNVGDFDHRTAPGHKIHKNHGEGQGSFAGLGNVSQGSLQQILQAQAAAGQGNAQHGT